MAPLSSLSTTDPASPPATQKAAAEAVVGVGPEAGAGAGPGAGPGAVASTLIDLGATSQQAGSTEAPVSSVLENELKALGKSNYIYWGFLRIWDGRVDRRLA